MADIFNIYMILLVSLTFFCLGAELAMRSKDLPSMICVQEPADIEWVFPARIIGCYFGGLLYEDTHPGQKWRHDG